METPQEVGKPQRKAFRAWKRSEDQVASLLGPLRRVAKPDAGGTEYWSLVFCELGTGTVAATGCHY